MYTLATTPSPIASPRAAYLESQQRPKHQYSPSSSRSTAFSSAQSPRVSDTARLSPRLFTTTSPKARASNALSATSQDPKDRSAVSSDNRDSRGQFVDAGTQYSPDGYPPTAFSRERKRKELSRPRSPVQASSSTAKSEAHMAAAAVSMQAPSEPHVREQSTADIDEPREARSTAVGAIKRQRSANGQVKMMPRAYETCDPKDLGILISNMLMELIRLNDQIPLRDGRLTRFHSRAPPGISVSDYLQRLIQHATLSPPILLSMVYYIDRLCQLYSAFTINSLTAHRFLITAATVAAKGLSDSFWTNPTYARIGGIPVPELATLELEFLQKVQWKIVPKPETLVDYYNSLVDRTEGYELEAGVEGEIDSTDVSPDGSDAMEMPSS